MVTKQTGATHANNPYQPISCTEGAHVYSKFWRFQILFAIAGGALGVLFPVAFGVRLIFSVWSTGTNDGTPAFVGLCAIAAAPLLGIPLAIASGLIGTLLDLFWFLATGQYSLLAKEMSNEHSGLNGNHQTCSANRLQLDLDAANQRMHDESASQV
ncbi:MAG: hypothetical protein Rhob2KO_31470 [Rhodopirellula baltica]